MTNDFRDRLVEHRPHLLRHSYRMLGSFADAEDVVQDVLVSAINARDTYSGDVPLAHWLMRITTNACLNELARRKRRVLPQLERDSATTFDALDELEAASWITPAPDAHLFAPSETLEARESVALAFVALLQRLPPRQRAALLLKDVVGFSSEEIASTLGTTLASVSSALHRARETIAIPPENKPDHPHPEILREWIRSWEERDIDALVRLLKHDVVFAMPPFATWFRGVSRVSEFLRSKTLAPFWSRTTVITPTRANGDIAFAFHVVENGERKAHSLQVVRLENDRVAHVTQFIGAHNLRGF